MPKSFVIFWIEIEFVSIITWCIYILATTKTFHELKELRGVTYFIPSILKLFPNDKNTKEFAIISEKAVESMKAAEAHANEMEENTKNAGTK